MVGQQQLLSHGLFATAANSNMIYVWSIIMTLCVYCLKFNFLGSIHPDLVAVVAPAIEN